MAPDHGEDDFELCRANGIDPVFAVDAGGFYRPDWLWLGGAASSTPSSMPEADLLGLGRRAARGSADFQHSYPHSWRSKAKVIIAPQWFIAMDKRRFSAETRAEQRWDNEGGYGTPTLRKLAHDRDDSLRAGERPQPPRIDGRTAAGLGDQPPARLGVPIALFVAKKTGELLVDHEVNERIVAAVHERGVDAWDAQNASGIPRQPQPR